VKVSAKLAEFIRRRWKIILGVGGALIVVSIFGSMGNEMATGIETHIDPKSQVYKDYMRFSEHFGGDPAIILLTGGSLEQLLSTDNIQAMTSIEDRLAPRNDPGVKTVIGPPSVLRMFWQQETGLDKLPENPNQLYKLVVDPETDEIRPQFQSIFPDKQHALIMVVPEGAIDLAKIGELGERVIQVVDETTFSGLQAVVSGNPVFGNEMSKMMSGGMRNAVMVSVILMLIVMAVVFNARGKFPRRWLALGLVLVATLYTFGLMGWLQIPINMASMTIFAIMIGLGVDYGIQFHNRYDEELRHGQSAGQAIVNAVSRMAPAVFVALAAVCVGSTALFISPTPMIRDFGLMLILALCVSYLVALFLLTSVLYWRDRHSSADGTVGSTEQKPPKRDRHYIERWLRSLTPKVAKRPAVIIPIALALTVAGFVADPHVEVITDDMEFLSPETSVMKTYRSVVEVTEGTFYTNVMVEAEDVLDPAILAWIADREQHILSQHNDSVASINSLADLLMQHNQGKLPKNSTEAVAILHQIPPLMKTNLVNADNTAANVVLGLKDIKVEELEALNERLRDDIANPPQGADVVLTGFSAMRVNLLNALTHGRWQMTGLGVGLILLALFFLFRLNPLKTLMVTIPIGLIIGWSSGMMYLFGIKFTPLSATTGLLIMGIGTEYTVLVLWRYYEERKKGIVTAEAMTRAVSTIGRAILASGLTTIAGFGALLSATDFIILRDFGIVIMIGVAMALLSTLVVLPPLVVWLEGLRERLRTV
jgi:hydrophobe/amphiphile efflux-3 (HAE3) family protein